MFVEGPNQRGTQTAQNPDLQQLLQMWRAGRVSLLAVVLNYVLSSVSTKLGAGTHSCCASCFILSSSTIHSLSNAGEACLALYACSMSKVHARSVYMLWVCFGHSAPWHSAQCKARLY